MISEGDRLLARGMPVTIEGQALRVHFGMESLLYLEKEYEGLDLFYAALMEEKFGKARINTIFTGMVAGLLETKPEEQDVEDFKAQLLKRLEPKDMLQYLEAVIVAFGESIPSFENAGPKAKGSRGNSHGRASTGMVRSTSAAVNGNSGG